MTIAVPILASCKSLSNRLGGLGVYMGEFELKTCYYIIIFP